MQARFLVGRVGLLPADSDGGTNKHATDVPRACSFLPLPLLGYGLAIWYLEDSYW